MQPSEIEEQQPAVHFWLETAIVQWRDKGHRLDLCFPRLASSSSQLRTVKVWGVRRGQDPYLIAKSEFADVGLSVNVTVYSREWRYSEQVVVTCGTWDSQPAAILSTIGTPPAEENLLLQNEGLQPRSVLSYQTVDKNGDLVRAVQKLDPGRTYSVPPEAWALVYLDD